MTCNRTVIKDGENATHKIIALDFDGTIHMGGDQFPSIGEPRPFIKQVVNRLSELGVKIIIWTCRDKGEKIDDLAPMEDWLKGHGIHYDAVNSSIQFAPWEHYNARKIFAHMYVDDKGFGWHDSTTIMLDVFSHFTSKHLGMTHEQIQNEIAKIIGTAHLEMLNENRRVING